MNRTKVLLQLALLLLSCHLSAQIKVLDRIYADVNIGGFPLDNAANYQFQAGLGWLVDERHGFGLSYHVATGGNVYNFQSINGLGVDYRYASRSGIIAKLGIGKAFRGEAATDSEEYFEYRSSKLFTDLSLTYQFKIGITLGVYAIYSPELIFETFVPASSEPPYPDGDELISRGQNAESFNSIGFTIGYALPLRMKR